MSLGQLTIKYTKKSKVCFGHSVSNACIQPGAKVCPSPCLAITTTLTPCKSPKISITEILIFNICKQLH